MEQLLVIIQQICEFLSILNSYTQEECEELLEGYPRFLSEAKELLSILDRIVGGSTYWGWKIEWGMSAMASNDLLSTKGPNTASRLGR